MQFTHLAPVDLAIVAIYFAAVLLVGFFLKRETNTSESFFLANRSITSWVAGLSFVAANMGALELMGWAASTYEYGIITVQWYWIGSVPAILFLAIVMMPFYYHSRATSVPGYLRQRFGEPSRALSAVSFAAMTLLMSGINMFAMAKVMQVMLGWNLHFSIWASALTVAVYVVLGGLTSAILNEVLQFFLIWMGALVIPILGLIECGGWNGLTRRITTNLPHASSYLHVWSTLGSPQANPMGVDWFGIIFGLALVAGFGYWTTDFLVVQRVMVARDLRTAQMAPVIGAFAKMAIPIIVVLPGLIGLGIFMRNGSPIHLVPETAARVGDYTYNDVLPLLLIRYAGPGLLGLGVTALIAGFMSGMAGNVSAFATVWTFDIYQPLIRRIATERHYLAVGRWSSLLGVLFSIGTAYFALHFTSIMDYVQALFSFFVSPLFFYFFILLHLLGYVSCFPAFYLVQLHIVFAGQDRGAIGSAKRTWVWIAASRPSRYWRRREPRRRPSTIWWARARTATSWKRRCGQPWEDVRENVRVESTTGAGDLRLRPQLSPAREGTGDAAASVAQAIKRLRELQGQKLTRDELSLKLGAAKKEAGKACGLLTIDPTVGG